MKATKRSTSLAAAVATLLALGKAAEQAFIQAENAVALGDACALGDAAACLLAQAEVDLRAVTDSISRSPLTSATASYWIHGLWPVEAFIRGAMSLAKSKPCAAPALTALEAVQAMTYTLKQSVWPEETEQQHHAREFVAGKALAADMLEEAISYADHDVAELFATYRRRGEEQKEFVSKYLAQTRSGTTHYAGFCAVLAGTLSAAGSAGLDPKETRDATYIDCFGGPDTKYMSEDDDSSMGERAPREVILDELEAHLNAAAKIECAPDVKDWTAQAITCCRSARTALGISAVEELLQEARRLIYKARTDRSMVVNVSELDPKQLALFRLVAAHRLLNKCLGGTMAEDRANLPRGVIGTIVDRLFWYLDATEHAPHPEEDHQVFDDIHSKIWSPFFECREAEERGHDEGAVRLFPKLRAGISAAFAHCDVNDGRWPLLRVSLEVLDDFLSTHGNAAAEPASGPPKATGWPAVRQAPVIAKKTLAGAPA